MPRNDARKRVVSFILLRVLLKPSRLSGCKTKPSSPRAFTAAPRWLHAIDVDKGSLRISKKPYRVVNRSERSHNFLREVH
jgi:hypothetical protein